MHEIDSQASQTRAESLTKELETALNGVRASLAVLRESQLAAETFFDDLGMDPDKGTYDNPPVVASGLLQTWSRIPAPEEVESLFQFTNNP